MSDMVCAHGQLSRQCELCEALNTIADLTATVERLRGELDNWKSAHASHRETVSRQEGNIRSLETERDALRQQLAAAQADAGRYRSLLEQEADYCYGYAVKYEATDPERAKRHRDRGDRLYNAIAMQDPQP